MRCPHGFATRASSERSDSNNNTPTFTYNYDSMMRLSTMSDSSNYTQPVVNGATYNAANQITALNYYNTTESRGYNNLMQLTNITASIGNTQQLNVSYNYTNGQNNGKIASTSDTISGETVTYQYDSLNRLISASGSGWTQTQAYDPFGNLTGRTGKGAASGTSISTPVNPATNQLSCTYSYDANGNLISTGYTYDPENRIQFAVAGNYQYFYDGQNKRIWQASCNSGSCLQGFVLQSEIVNMFGADGKMLATYTPSVPWNNTQTQLTVSFTVAAERAYFGGKLVAQMSNGTMTAAVQDRLGSVGKYYPYGEDRSGQTGSDTVRFATYTRDSATGNDYADQRYYSSALGRFMTVDPANAGAMTNPQSLNRYAYVLGDPINSWDPGGLCPVILGGITQTPYTPGTVTEQQFASDFGAITALPYAGGDVFSGVANVLAQGAAIPTGAVLTALNAIALAAQTPGPISIVAFSGGAQAFASAYALLNAATRSRISDITYIDPGSAGSLPTAERVVVLEDSSDFVNTLMQLVGAMGTPTSPNPNVPQTMTVDTGTCGHNLACVLTNYYGWASPESGPCQVGATGIFGAAASPIIFPINDPFGWIISNILSDLSIPPPTPSITETITYKLP